VLFAIGADVPNHQQSDRLSWGDTVFLHMERETMPLNVASVCIFDGEISRADCLQFVESKLPLLPRYLKRVVGAPLGLGLPSWEYDTDFDLRRHIREEALTRGTEVELKALAGKLFSQVMDRNHPLWDITLVHGLKENRTAVIFRLHHCLADGIAGVGIISVLLDASPTAPRLPRKKIKFTVPPPRDPLTSLTSGVVDSYSELAQRVLSAMADLMNMGERAAMNGGQLFPTDELSDLLPEITAFTERLRFNVKYEGPQKFAWIDIPLAEVKQIRHTFGASVNDVILALVTASIRRYLEFHGDRVKGRLFRMMVPVNLRGKDCTTEPGNRISIIPVTVPLDIRDPKKLLQAVHRRTEFLKQSHAAEIVSLSAGFIGMLPTGLQAVIGPMISQLPVTPFNLVCTNVPGPQYPLYLLGRKMLRWYPYVPVGGEMAVNCAVLSYDGNIGFGFSGDVHAAPDLRRLEELLKVSFAELREAAGLTPPRKKSSPKRKTMRVAAPTSKSEPASQPAAIVLSSIPLTVPAPPVETAAPPPVTEEEKILATVA
jgi:diacylglycerol O-acyltransferase / wax synthase